MLNNVKHIVAAENDCQVSNLEKNTFCKGNSILIRTLNCSTFNDTAALELLTTVIASFSRAVFSLSPVYC